MDDLDEDSPKEGKPLAGTFEDKQKLLVTGLFLAGLFILALGIGLTFFKKGPSDSDVKIVSGEQSPISSSKIIVDISGAVAKPGVYELALPARVKDAVDIAGGLAMDADNSKINLAAKIVDGQKINIPKVGENVGSVAGTAVSDLISINSATEAELDKLPGVGPVTAGKIIAGRPYGTLEELVSKKAVSKSVFEKIKEMISL